MPQDCHFAAKDGTQLHGWFLYPHSKTPKEAAAGSTIVFFQENAGTMSMRLPFLRDLIRLSGCSIFAPRQAQPHLLHTVVLRHSSCCRTRIN